MIASRNASRFPLLTSWCFGMFWKFHLKSPPQRLVCADAYFRGNGTAPIFAASMSRSVRDSAMVLLIPMRVETSACTRSSSCSSNSTMNGSVFAKAKVFLGEPSSFLAVGLSLSAGSIPNVRNILANLGPDPSSLASISGKTPTASAAN
ncbi:hypothetical protein D3C87_905900 [compost metagenome]